MSDGGEKDEDMLLKNISHQHDILTYFVQDSSGRDTIIRTNQGYTECHRLLLAAASSLFYQILKENCDEEQTIVLMPDYSAAEVEDLVSRLYSTSHNTDGFSEILPSQAEGGRIGGKVHTLLDRQKDLRLKIELEEIDVGSTDSINRSMLRDDDMTIVPDITSHLEYMDYGSGAEAGLMSDSESDYERAVKKKKKKVTKTKKKKIKLTDEEPVAKKKETKKNGRPSIFPYACEFCSKVLVDHRKKYKHRCKPADLLQNVGNLKGDDLDFVNDLKTGIICHLCGTSFLSPSLLKAHLAMNCENVCEICRSVLHNRTELREHMFKVHHKVIKRRTGEDTEKTVHCTQCTKSYTKQFQLNHHVKKVHNAEVVPVKFQCQECGKLMSSRVALRKHSSLHKPPEHSCPICGKLFHNRQYLSRHALSQHAEQGIQKHQCDMCDKGFNNKEALQGHRNWHLNLKPYQCRWCERSYQNTSNTAAHERKSHRDVYMASLKNGNRRFQIKEEIMQISSKHSILIV
ncbi:zinc finger protein 366 [Eurytemora carolleeae]|uniref:zinc finger protein 366 n=1 Tax=Eurytemora carolleeae TaxID=1294199 RepID=UPI000C75D998|nr:zinc finger protein 366 [Eurytemora carolleeae]|eukprot:XP_023336017.1 zinc finger protein 366-like [Eurytemora affinis]